MGLEKPKSGWKKYENCENFLPEHFNLKFCIEIQKLFKRSIRLNCICVTYCPSGHSITGSSSKCEWNLVAHLVQVLGFGNGGLSLGGSQEESLPAFKSVGQ